MSSRRKGQGRQKTEMKKMSNESHLQVTFSKRRSGLFKKASELCTLCGVDIALVVFSPSEKVFSFGHPNIYTVIDRYLSLSPPENNDTLQFIEAHRSVNVRELNAQLTEINNTLDAEKKLGDELSRIRKAVEAQFWWACPFDGMNMAQLELLKKALEQLKTLVVEHADKVLIQGAPSQTLPTFVGNDSSSNIYLHHQPNPQHPQMFQPKHF
ncbi:agamous-like MADS-box protein AGL62 [Vicia villosa]|uniref:agamous-like MADS-box protein AGL62 n=1 Tax=Vicia villosa TaxID=3911 RepID=UPI00273C38EE|nr:agamous-like MADS-box protein AGL62 [Vicia villosa]